MNPARLHADDYLMAAISAHTSSQQPGNYRSNTCKTSKRIVVARDVFDTQLDRVAPLRRRGADKPRPATYVILISIIVITASSAIVKVELQIRGESGTNAMEYEFACVERFL